MLDVVLVSGFVVGGLFIMCWILGDWKLEVLETIKPIWTSKIQIFAYYNSQSERVTREHKNRVMNLTQEMFTGSCDVT